MANLYVEVKITWVFDRSPASFSFYSDPNCDAFNMGRFDDSITNYEIVEVVGNKSLTLAKVRADFAEKYRHRMAVTKVEPITRAKYIEEIDKRKEECAA